MTGVSHVLLDFFGTLVDYSPSRTDQGYHASYALTRSMGASVEYEEFLTEWVAVSTHLDDRSAADDSEFSMDEAATMFLARLLGRASSADEVGEFVELYVSEWNTGVVYPAAVIGVVESLAERFRLAVVTNTHKADLVPCHLAAMRIAGYFETVVTSVEVGRRKPHPAIFHEALRRLGVAAGSAVFVGDTYLPDYVGPEAVGITAFLIDPRREHDVPAKRRLRSLEDLVTRLDPATAAHGR